MRGNNKPLGKGCGYIISSNNQLIIGGKFTAEFEKRENAEHISPHRLFISTISGNFCSRQTAKDIDVGTIPPPQW